MKFSFEFYFNLIIKNIKTKLMITMIPLNLIQNSKNIREYLQKYMNFRE